MIKIIWIKTVYVKECRQNFSIPDTMEIAFARNLKELRKAEKLSQGMLADKLGVTQRKVSYWESGKIEPSLADLWKISDFFEVTVDYLIGKKDF